MTWILIVQIFICVFILHWLFCFIPPIIIRFRFPNIWFFEIWAMVIPPCIFVNTSITGYSEIQYDRMIRHEKQHIRQNAWFSPFVFEIIYLLNFLINLFIYKFDVFDAYYNIWFEKDARNAEEEVVG